MFIVGMVAAADYIVDDNMNVVGNDIYNATNVNATNFYQNGSKVLDSSSSVNANNSDYWDGLDTPIDIETMGNFTACNINASCNLYVGTIQATDSNSISIQPTGDTDDYFSFKTPAHRPTIKREGGKYIYFDSSNVYDMGLSLREDDTHSGTLNYDKVLHMIALVGKASPIGFKPNSYYNNYILMETINSQPQISVWNGTVLKINDSLLVEGSVNATSFYYNGHLLTIYSHLSNFTDDLIRTTNTPTYSTVEDYVDVTQSAGHITGGTFAANADGSLNVSAGTGIIKDSDSATANTSFFDWVKRDNIVLTDDDTNYIYVNMNGGTPTINVTLTKSDVNGRTKIGLGQIFREGTTLHTIQAGMGVTEGLKRTQGYLNNLHGDLVRTSGCVIGEVPELYLSSTSGKLQAGLTPLTISAINTNVTDFTYFYYNGTGWMDYQIGQINNTQYNDVTSGLSTLSNNKYGVHWIYECVSGHLMVVYGQDDYSQAEAETAQPPSSLPNHVSDFGFLAAKVIIEKNAVTFFEVSSAYDTLFIGSQAADYNDLSNLPDLTVYLLTDGTRTGVLNWTSLQNYPTACPTGTYMTTIGDTTTCTAVDPSGFTVNDTGYFDGLDSTSFLRSDEYDVKDSTLNMSNNNILDINSSCYNADCSSKIYHNGTHLIIGG